MPQLAIAVFALWLVAGGPAAPPPAPSTTAPAANATTAAPGTAPTVAPTAAAAAVSNPPTSAAQVDAINLNGKNITVTYWHNRPQKDQDLLQGMLDDFNKTNPYGIKAKAEIAGASYNDVYNKVN